MGDASTLRETRATFIERHNAMVTEMRDLARRCHRNAFLERPVMLLAYGTVWFCVINLLEVNHKYGAGLLFTLWVGSFSMSCVNLYRFWKDRHYDWSAKGRELMYMAFQYDIAAGVALNGLDDLIAQVEAGTARVTFSEWTSQ